MRNSILDNKRGSGREFTLLEMIGVFSNLRAEPDPSKGINISVTFDPKTPCVVGELLQG